MTKRTDLITACPVDLTLMLLPTIGWKEAALTLAANDVPLAAAARVLALPLKRRAFALDISPAGRYDEA